MSQTLNYTKIYKHEQKKVLAIAFQPENAGVMEEIEFILGNKPRLEGSQWVCSFMNETFHLNPADYLVMSPLHVISVITPEVFDLSYELV